MFSLKEKFSKIPEGSGALFFIQIFCTLAYAVLYSTLVLYATKHLNFTAKEATAVMGVFGAFNYGLHLFGGYLGGRFLSNRNLFVGGMILQVIGCACIAGGSVDLLYWGLAPFLVGSGLNVTCVNMMLTQRFKPDDIRREGAFLWNYAGMNLGFFIGFLVAGYYQELGDYRSLFIFASLGNVVAMALAAVNWKIIGDLSTPLLEATSTAFKARFAAGTLIMIGLVPVIYWLLQHAALSSNVVQIVGAGITFTLLYLTLTHRDARERNNMWAYLILAVGYLVFWALSLMMPMGLELFAENNVDRQVLGFEIAPQWILNINSFVIMIGGPLMSALFVRLRARGWNIDIPRQFAASLLLIGIGFLALRVGIATAGADGKTAFVWIALCYLLQSVAELLSSPIGYAMIGKLAPKQYQGIMMGTWMLSTGVASTIASYFSGLVPEPTPGLPASTNAAYSQIFSTLGWAGFAVGVGLVVLIPFLRKLIKDADSAPAQAAVPEEKLAA